MIREQQKKIEIGIVKKQNTLKDQVKIVYLGIGSNLGNRKANINIAKFKLEAENIKISECSSNYESLSWPNPNRPNFINIVLKVKTFLNEKELLAVCNKIETELGRVRLQKNDPRTCDIDILDYDKKVIEIKGKDFLNIPHPEISNRNFVLLPLFEIEKDWVHPIKKTNIKKLILSLSNKDIRSIKQI